MPISGPGITTPIQPKRWGISTQATVPAYLNPTLRPIALGVGGNAQPDILRGVAPYLNPNQATPDILRPIGAPSAPAIPSWLNPGGGLSNVLQGAGSWLSSNRMRQPIGQALIEPLTRAAGVQPGSRPYPNQTPPTDLQRQQNSDAYWQGVLQKGGRVPTVAVNAFGEMVSDNDPSAVSTTSNGTVSLDKNGRVVADRSPEAVQTKQVHIPIPTGQEGGPLMPDWLRSLAGALQGSVGSVMNFLRPGAYNMDLYGPNSPLMNPGASAGMNPTTGVLPADWQNYVVPDVLRGYYPINVNPPETVPNPPPKPPPTWYGYGGGGGGGYDYGNYDYSTTPSWINALTRWVVRR